MTLLRGIMEAVEASRRQLPAETSEPVQAPATIPPRTRTRTRLFPPAPPEIVAPSFPAEAVRRSRRTGPVPSDDRYLDMPWGADYFKKHLYRSDRIPQVSRIGTEYVHVSSLVDFCGRAYGLAPQEGVIMDAPPTGGHRVMWKIGRAIEQHVREGIIAARNGVGCLGTWVCPCGQLEHTGERRLTPCARCDQPADYYREMVLFDNVAGIVGTPDLPVLVDGWHVAPLEIKSMNKDDWKDLVAPRPDHVFQVLSYDRLFRRNGYETVGEGALIYVTKDFKWGDPYKEFHIEAGQREHEAILNMAWEEAAEVKRAREAGTILPRVKCQNIAQPRAKACPVSGSCFMRGS